MNSPSLPPMDDDITSLLRRERLSEPFPPSGARERAFDAVMAKVAAAEALARVPQTAALPPKTPKRGAAIAAALAVGALLGALVATLVPTAFKAPKATAPSTHEVVYVPVDVPIGYPTFTAAPDLTFEDVPKVKTPAPQASQTGAGLTAERNLLDAARVALASGEANEAVRLAERHRRDFPAGALVEEREAIATKALVDAHRPAEAKARGAAFEKRFPQSAMLRSVKSSLATLTDTP
jgi:hypothetical protein